VSLVVGQRMVRTDDGMRGVVELVQVPGFDEMERRIVYFDRGETRLAGKREAWEPMRDPPRQLRDEEIMLVAGAADRMLETLDKNQPDQWWSRTSRGPAYDAKLYSLIVGYLKTRG
jgi:hypothetical protein